MRKLTICLLLGALCAVSVKASTIDPVNLGTAASYAVLAGSTVTNVPAAGTIITGDLGVSPGTSITGFGVGLGVVASPYSIRSTTDAALAQIALGLAWTDAGSRGGAIDKTGIDLGLLTLDPGVYSFSSGAQLTGTLHLNGGASDVWIFQIGTLLNTASASKVVFNGAGVGDNLFWKVDTATLGTTTAFQGTIMANTSISLATDATINCGRALARSGAVTMDSNRVSIPAGPCQSGTSAPEPGTLSLLSLSLGCCGIAFLRSKRR